MGSVLSKAPDSSSLGAAVVAVVAGAAALRWWQRRRTHQRCRARITAKRQDVAGKLAAAASRWSLPADQAAAAAAVVSMSPTQLLSAMRDGTLSAEFVMRSYIHMAISAQALYNPISDPLFESAIAQARERDQLRASAAPLGPLHGLPISVKDNLVVAGGDCTLGTARLALQPHEADGLLVGALRDAGAVPFAKTCVPQSLLVPETVSPLFGTTLNPYNTTRVPGGSSGGEAALLAAGGSVVGIGTDVGGSVRIPAHCCGLTAIKPTSARISKLGHLSTVRGQEGIASCAGPISVSVEGLAAVLRVWLSPAVFERDPTLPPLPFDEAAFRSTRPLRFGFYVADGFHPPSNAIQRAVRETADRLRAAGHTVVEFPIQEFDLGAVVEYYYAMIGADAFSQVFEGLEGEVIERTLYPVLFANSLPRSISGALGYLLKLVGQPVLSKLAFTLGLKDADRMWRSQAARTAWKQKLLQRWQELDLDLLITPGLVTPAFRLGVGANMNAACSPTFIWNWLDFPAASCPITLVTEHDLATPRRVTEATSKRCAAEDAASVGLPVSVQVVGLPFQDELVLRGAKEIETLTNFQDTARLRARLAAQAFGLA